MKQRVSKQLISLYCLLIGFFFTLAPSSYAAPTLTQLIEQRLTERSKVKGKYKQKKFLQKINQELNSSGNFQFIRGEKIEWFQIFPFKSSIKMSATTLSVEDGKRAVETMSLDANPDLKIIQDIFFSLLNGDQIKLKEYFEIKARGPVRDWQLILTPKSKDISLVIDTLILKGDLWLSQIEIVEKNKNKTTIYFQAQSAL
jgi:hypothetical protein